MSCKEHIEGFQRYQMFGGFAMTLNFSLFKMTGINLMIKFSTLMEI